MDEQQPFNRRNFFRQGLKELLKPLSNAVAPIEEIIKQIGAVDSDIELASQVKATPQNNAPVSDPSSLLGIPIRPPGALQEQKFRETCSHCGECVRVCPVSAIKMDSSGVKGAGAPYIEIDSAPCVLCDGLRCMNTCPSGALIPIPIQDIDMGTAVWHEPLCLRTHGEPCKICVDDCPIGEMAIVLDNGRVRVIENGCTGCGVCQNHCPTNPKSIIVSPRPIAGGATLPRGRSR